MQKWFVVIVLGALTHFGASYLVPLAEKDQGLFGGLLRWVWPWGVGDSGLLGKVNPSALPGGGLFLALAATVLSAMALLAVLGIWVPAGWSRALAIGGALLVVVLMIGFFGPTKVLPILVALGVIAAVTFGWRTFQVA